MVEVHTEKRRFTRVELALPVEIHQGGSVWYQSLIDISLNGVATDQPDEWDAQYNEPFTLIIFLEDDNKLELHAYLQRVEANRLGFTVQHVDEENTEPLRAVLEAHMDLTTLEEELKLLSN
ncbi:MAG: hypothetical protein ACI9NT_000967 [Bacteroidia bacterium]|jgi:hypothetical protein